MMRFSFFIAGLCLLISWYISPIDNYQYEWYRILERLGLGWLGFGFGIWVEK